MEAKKGKHMIISPALHRTLPERMSGLLTLARSTNVMATMAQRCTHRCRQLSTKTGLPIVTINMPSNQTTKSWERSAKLVKSDVQNEYVDTIRKPAMHLKTIEDELRGTMGKALGKQGEKILRFVRAMGQERQRYDELLEKVDTPLASKEVKNTVERYNELRKEAIKARWELLVHRQAVGFIVDNHNTVARHFPIGPPLSIGDSDNENGEADSKKQTFGTQTDWWQRIGRWR